MEMLHGGLNKTDLFHVIIDSGAYVVKQTDKTTTATSNAHKFLRMNLNISSDFAWQSDGTLKLTLENVGSSKILEDKIAETRPGRTNSGGLEVITLEDGTKSSEVAGANNLFLAISYNVQTGSDKVITVACIGTFDPTSGSFKAQADTYRRPTFILNSIHNQYNLNVKALLDTAIVDNTADFIIPSDKGGKIDEVAVAA